jgi:hypothetical protein
MFKLETVSKHGIAHYTREGFRQGISVSTAHFADPSNPPAEIAFAEGTPLAEKAPARAKQKPSKLKAAIAALSPEQKKAVQKAAREAAQAAGRKALEEAGVSL